MPCFPWFLRGSLRRSCVALARYSVAPKVAGSHLADLDDGVKRAASYQIMKNRGLVAHKAKINRNPRVKKKEQFRKATIARKGQVQFRTTRPPPPVGP